MSSVSILRKADIDRRGSRVYCRSSGRCVRRGRRTSTPTIKGRSAIETEYERSDKRRYSCPCQKCGAFQTFKLAQLRLDENKPGTARYHCEVCDHRHDDAARLTMISTEAGAEWRATATSHGVAGFHLKGIASPFKAKRGHKSLMHQMASDFLGTKKKGKLAHRDFAHSDAVDQRNLTKGSLPTPPPPMLPVNPRA